MRKTSKYRMLKRFSHKSKAEAFMEKLGRDNLSIFTRKFKDKDKTRVYVRELVRKGSK